MGTGSPAQSWKVSEHPHPHPNPHRCGGCSQGALRTPLCVSCCGVGVPWGEERHTQREIETERDEYRDRDGQRGREGERKRDGGRQGETGTDRQSSQAAPRVPATTPLLGCAPARDTKSPTPPTRPHASKAPPCPVPGAFCSSPEPPCPAPSSVAVLVPRAGKGSGLCPREPCSLLTCCQHVSGPGRDSCTHHPGPKPSHPRGAGWLALPLLLSPPCTRTLLPGAQSGLGSLGPWSGGPYLLGSSCSRAQPDPFWL